MNNRTLKKAEEIHERIDTCKIILAQISARSGTLMGITLHYEGIGEVYVDSQLINKENNDIIDGLKRGLKTELKKLIDMFQEL